MNTHTFKLYRRVRNPETGGVIISAFNLDRECEDPFRERMKLCREFPRWAIGSDFSSAVDREFEALVEPELGEPFDDLDVTYEVHDGNTLKGPTATDADECFTDEIDKVEEHWANAPKIPRKISFGDLWKPDENQEHDGSDPRQ